MNIIKFIKQKIQKKSFDSKIQNVLDNVYDKESGGDLIHNNGKICRDGGDLFKLEHDTTDGIYLRRMILNKSTAIVSGVHKRDHVWFLLHGSISVSSAEGVEHFDAPWVGFSKAGTQRAIYANEYSIFQNVFKNPNNLKTLDDLEDYNYCATQEEYKKYKKNK